MKFVRYLVDVALTYLIIQIIGLVAGRVILGLARKDFGAEIVIGFMITVIPAIIYSTLYVAAIRQISKRSSSLLTHILIALALTVLVYTGYSILIFQGLAFTDSITWQILISGFIAASCGAVVVWIRARKRLPNQRAEAIGNPRSSELKIVLALLATLVLLYVLLPWFLLPVQTRTVWRYRQILERWKPELTVHFPEKIPRQARDARLYFFPGFLQGGASFQVRFQLPAEEVRALYSQFSRQAVETLPGGVGVDRRQSDGRPIAPFYTGNEKYHRFPEGYEILTLDPVYTAHSPGFYWNHGRSHGVAINTNLSEIVYWAQAW